MLLLLCNDLLSELISLVILSHIYVVFPFGEVRFPKNLLLLL